jgi:hypothetical protein
MIAEALNLADFRATSPAVPVTIMVKVPPLGDHDGE